MADCDGCRSDRQWAGLFLQLFVPLGPLGPLFFGLCSCQRLCLSDLYVVSLVSRAFCFSAGCHHLDS